jgi:uncharacterized FlaG/YvyC family protein
MLSRERDLNKSDYELLESAAQKAEAEVRELFKIQHQQKLYQDDLEEKVRELEAKLEEADKKLKLYQAVRCMGFRVSRSMRRSRRS